MFLRSRWVLALLATVAGLAPGAAVPARESSRQSAVAGDVRSLAQRFLDAFESWRDGADSEHANARALASELGAAGRPDVPRILAHYEALTPEQRRVGMRVERRVQSLRSELARAYEEGLRDEDWEEARIPLEDGIEGALEESRGLADRGARGQALALRAEYFVTRLETLRGSSLDPEERQGIAEQIESDTRESLAEFGAFDIVRAALNPQLTKARIEHFLGNLSAARTTYEALAAAAQSLGDDEKLSEAYDGMLAIARDRGDEVESEMWLGKLAKLRDANRDWPLARAWAMRLIHADRADEARDFLDRFQGPADSDDSLDALLVRRGLAYVRALALLRLGRFDLASDLARAQPDASRLLRGGEFERDYLTARIALASGRPRDALACFGEAERLERLDASDEGAARTLLGSAKLALGDARGAKLELELALTLAEGMRQRAMVEPLSSLEESRRFNFIGEWEGAGVEAVALLARANLELGDALSAAIASEDWQSRSLRGEGNDLARVLERAGQPNSPAPLSRDDLESWASLTELGLVTWVFGADSGVVVHVARRSDGRFDCAGEVIHLRREQLREGVSRLRESAISGEVDRTIALEIRERLLPASILAHIGEPKSDRDRLLFLLHGPMEALPVELFEWNGLPIDEALCVVVLPGLPSASPGLSPSRNALGRWQLLGAPVDGSDGDGVPVVALLPGAVEELKLISKLRPKSPVIQGPELRQPAFERALISGDCLHISTHLEVKAGEPRSRFPAAGLRLDDGVVISARQIAQIFPRSPLVVLSACETGGGRYSDGEGLFGVARAFLEGGTRDLVVTLWPVEDGAARDFAVAFHRALGDGMAPSEATRRGRRSLREAGYSPADWAAFRFLGRD